MYLPSEVLSFKKFFDELDEDKSGTVEADEVLNGVRGLSGSMNRWWRGVLRGFLHRLVFRVQPEAFMSARWVLRSLPSIDRRG
jgi:hypothetical protein